MSAASPGAMVANSLRGPVVETGESRPCRLRSLKSSWGGRRGKCLSWQKLNSNRACSSTVSALT
eukprot:9349976-Pyramimonas_sp.AAC.1